MVFSLGLGVFSGAKCLLVLGEAFPDRSDQAKSNHWIGNLAISQANGGIFEMFHQENTRKHMWASFRLATKTSTLSTICLYVLDYCGLYPYKTYHFFQASPSAVGCCLVAPLISQQFFSGVSLRMAPNDVRLITVRRLKVQCPIWGRFPFWLIFFRWVETTD